MGSKTGNIEKGFRPRALGEIAIRCLDPQKMASFYEDVIGLERMGNRRSQNIIFFRIGAGFGGHTSILALFRGHPGKGPSSLHHFALSLPFDEQEAVISWYEKLGQPYHVEHFGWVGWRGVFTKDPEGNTVELVSYDSSLLDEPAG